MNNMLLYRITILIMLQPGIIFGLSAGGWMADADYIPGHHFPLTPLNLSFKSQGGILPRISLYNRPIVIGLDVGLFTTRAREVFGVQISGFGAGSETNVIGIQCGLMCVARGTVVGLQVGGGCEANNLVGLQVGFQPRVKNNLFGIQIGGFIDGDSELQAQNMYGIQFAIAKGFSNNGAGIQISLLPPLPYGHDIARNKANHWVGLQIALTYNEALSMTGIQLGLVNNATRMRGFQIGVINYTHRLTGIQLGLVNIIRESKIPAMIGINAALF